MIRQAGLLTEALRGFCLPILAYSGVVKAAKPIQRRLRAGFPPASLLSLRRLRIFLYCIPASEGLSRKFLSMISRRTFVRGDFTQKMKSPYKTKFTSLITMLLLICR